MPVGEGGGKLPYNSIEECELAANAKGESTEPCRQYFEQLAMGEKGGRPNRNVGVQMNLNADNKPRV